MSPAPLKTAVIIGSVREGRIAPLVTRWFVEQAATREDIEIDVIDLLEADLPDGLPGHFGGEKPTQVAVLSPRIAAADAFVVVVPEYNRGYPAALKIAIDSFNWEWQAKPVSFVSYGGISGGVRATEQLRTVFAELHAPAIRDYVAIDKIGSRFGPDGTFPTEPEGCNAAAKIMLDRLVWWGLALRDARAARPYAG
ncbi:NAD(P)H-dependent oxidoreductase [Spongiactinospora sp. TRM90649]|uniref:NADPH-dependent FMN reductase n=1 Tax=Spongiactinospora sp. TRM90649 TaxID=3031114 RepID=UPI0023F7A930|nr:NAD(P)H-dependent oxidoreductase [Spongiactinospora sp. TRM90649]MDF5754075.1 NAD(P)H-dependent oxidoreductase [Spongiactinospora sp. TRM90649]